VGAANISIFISYIKKKRLTLIILTQINTKPHPDPSPKEKGFKWLKYAKIAKKSSPLERI